MPRRLITLVLVCVLAPCLAAAKDMWSNEIFIETEAPRPIVIPRSDPMAGRVDLITIDFGNGVSRTTGFVGGNYTSELYTDILSR